MTLVTPECTRGVIDPLYHSRHNGGDRQYECDRGISKYSLDYVRDVVSGMWFREHGLRLGLILLVLAVRIADLDVVHPVLVLNLMFHHHKLIHTTITRYWKLTG